MYGFGELDTLVPAYAATVHKSQGSEYPAVVIPVLTQHYAMLRREPALHRGHARQAPGGARWARRRRSPSRCATRRDAGAVRSWTSGWPIRRAVRKPAYPPVGRSYSRDLRCPASAPPIPDHCWADDRLGKRPSGKCRTVQLRQGGEDMNKEEMAERVSRQDRYQARVAARERGGRRVRDNSPLIGDVDCDAARHGRPLISHDRVRSTLDGGQQGGSWRV